MSCMQAALQGGDPRREIFPILVADMALLEQLGMQAMFELLGVMALGELPKNAGQRIGAARKPDGTAFYLTTIAPDFGLERDPVETWRGAFFAPFGVGDVVGEVIGELAADPAMPIAIHVRARLLLDAGGNPSKHVLGRTPYVSVDWQIRGNQATRPNKSALIGSVNVIDPGPHNADDIRRCVSLHAPERSFGEPRAIVAMQCGVAAACLLEAIC